MDVRQIQAIILSKTYTKTDYLRRVTLIREYLERRIYKEPELLFPDYLNMIAASQFDVKALSHLDVHFFNLFTKDNLYLLINGLMDALRTLPVLTLYLAVILDEIQMDELGIWFRNNLNPELIIDVRCNPTIVSGCAYVWNNNYKDLSLHNFLSQKENIINKIIDAYAQEQL
ncbi:hypothetical protein A3I51_02595 [Candidatus Gottesmanbacteria bacterium RIFCSPLOWO2_02_FULL_38_8]|uniref:F-type ATPase subunit delta n=1 Tax=Candidatus Gottesmanbacteria bacterium RIFCSPLOWO2_02_FULL_38_8 TaxID=1798397 RepID=A0A1F6B649_9BACT|nr:MAG: hypothetical protein A3I51_02595 [Candidatus Gottesmanbacteria bacterium RIFCSPLOWO2_02_FULL_38_8]